MHPLLLLVGCSFGLVTVVDTDRGPDAAPAAAPRIASIDPAWGPPAGGDVVTIVGSGFVDGAVVRFGEADGLDITVLDPGTLTVVTPRVSAESVVDVTVETDKGADTLAEGFTYSRRPPDETDTDTDADSDADTDADTDTDTDTDLPTNAGKVSGYVAFDYSHLACPLCFGLAYDAHATVTASAAFHAPVDGSWLSWIPADGTCVSDPSQTGPTSAYSDAGTTLTLSDGTRTVYLYGGSGAAYAAGSLVSTDWSGGADWTVTASGGVDFPAFTLTSPLHTAAAITTIDPGSITTQNTGSAYTAGFPRTGSTINWTPSGTGDFVVVLLETSSGSTVVCRGPDNGSLTVPGSAVAGWSPDTQLLVNIVRYNVAEVVLPDESHVELIGRYEIVGTGIVR